MSTDSAMAHRKSSCASIPTPCTNGPCRCGILQTFRNKVCQASAVCDGDNVNDLRLFVYSIDDVEVVLDHLEAHAFEAIVFSAEISSSEDKKPSHMI